MGSGGDNTRLELKAMHETRIEDDLDTTKTQSEPACDVTCRSGDETARDDFSCRGHPEGHSDDEETFFGGSAGSCMSSDTLWQKNSHQDVQRVSRGAGWQHAVKEPLSWQASAETRYVNIYVHSYIWVRPGSRRACTLPVMEDLRGERVTSVIVEVKIGERFKRTS